MIRQKDIDLISTHFDFSLLNGKKILVTGGTGFIGRWLRAVPSQSNAQIYYCGATDYKECLGYYTYDYIIHCAPVGVSGVIECAKKNNAVILYTSSGAVYDDPPTELAQSKREAEDELLNSRLPVRIARLYTFSGSYLDPKRFAIARWITSGLAGEKIEVWGSGNQIRSYMYAADMTAWLWNILLRGKNSNTYPVGSETAVKMIDVARFVADELNTKVVLLPGESEGPRPNYIPDTAKTRLDLGLEEYTGWKIGVISMINSFKTYQPFQGDL